MCSPAADLTRIRTRWSSASTDDQFVVQNPATAQTVTVVQGAGSEEVDHAVRAAHTAHLRWKRRPARERRGYLRRVADVVRAHADELAGLESLEMGKPVTQARSDVEAAAAIFKHFAGFDAPLDGSPDGTAHDVTTLEPYGVIACLVPFTRPPMHTAVKVAPALAVGNAVVLQPPEQTPSVVLRMVDLMQSVLPDRVVHALPGRDEVSRALTGHRLVGKVSFTGSPRTGAAVLRTAAPNLTPTLMELGGRNPLVVFDDADHHEALLAAIHGGFFNQGEARTSSSRILVQDNILGALEAKLCAAVRRLRVGDGADPATDVGPLVTRAQQQQVLDHLSAGVSEGARIAAQAPLPDDPRLADGFFVPPTVLTGVTPRMRVARDEIGGPVVVLIPFADEDEAVRIANRTRFGLAAAVFTLDGDRALRVSSRMRAKTVFVNRGVGPSGCADENTRQTLAEYGYTKTIRLADNRDERPRCSAAARALEG